MIGWLDSRQSFGVGKRASVRDVRGESGRFRIRTTRYSSAASVEWKVDGETRREERKEEKGGEDEAEARASRSPHCAIPQSRLTIPPHACAYVLVQGGGRRIQGARRDSLYESK